MRRLSTLVAVIACLVPLSAAAQPAGQTTPRTQGPMTVEPIHSGFLVAPDVKVTEVDRKTSELVGGYAGWLTDDRVFIGGGGYWLANGNRNDREMAYGGVVVHWLVWNSGRVGLGAKGLLGGGEATLADTVTITPRVPEFRTQDGRGPATAPALVQRVRVRDGFLLAEPEAQLSLKLMKQLRLAIGAGYRFTGTDRHSFGSRRLDGATGSLALQIGGGS
jgi:hypothetical protein